MATELERNQVNRWNTLQVMAHDADLARKPQEASEYRAQAVVIECDLEAAGKNIRALVCP